MPKSFQNTIWILLFVAFAGWFGFEVLTASQKMPSEKQSYRAELAKGDAHSLPIPLSEPSKEATKRKERQAQAANHLKEFSVEFFNLKLSDAIIAIFTVVLAVKTAGLFRETAGLREATDKLWKAGERQIDAAVRAANAAERALNSTERAFVFLKNIYASPIFNPDRRVVGWDIHPVWENSGSTPTQFMVARKAWMIFPDGNIPADFQFPNLGSPIHSQSFIGPKNHIDAGALQISNDDLDIVAEGPARLLVWGWAEYNDIFNSNTRHRSEFCTEVDIDGNVRRPPDESIKPPFVFRLFERHNGSGAECFHRPMTAVPARNG